MRHFVEQRGLIESAGDHHNPLLVDVRLGINPGGF
jgi:hypothetical protein